MATAARRPQKKRSYGSGSVYQRSSDGMWIGTVELGWTAKGTRRRATVSAKTETECRRRLKAKIGEVQSGGAGTLSGATTVKSYADRWLEATQRTIRPKSWATNRSQITKWVVPIIGKKRLNALTNADIEAVANAQADAGIARSSRDRTRAVLLKMLRDAMADGATVHAGVFTKKERSKDRQRSDRRAIPLGDALKLLKEIEREPDPSRWVGILLNGQRQGERLGLERDAIDFERHEMRVSWQLQALPYLDNRNKHLGFRVPDDYEARHLEGRFHLVRPKTQAGERVVPLTPWFEAALRKHLEETPESKHGLVWCNADGSPIDPKVDLAEWRALQQRAGIAHPVRKREAKGQIVPDQYVLHEGRHTTITMLKELGVPDEVIVKIVGQSKLIQEYNHQDLGPEVRAALAGLETHLQLEPLTPPGA